MGRDERGNSPLGVMRCRPSVAANGDLSRLPLSAAVPAATDNSPCTDDDDDDDGSGGGGIGESVISLSAVIYSRPPAVYCAWQRNDR